MMNQRKSVAVSRASHVHHAPQIVFPQIGPVDEHDGREAESDLRRALGHAVRASRP